MAGSGRSRGHALRTYVLRRLLLILPTLLGISAVVFTLCQLVPGGPIDQMKMRMAGAAGAGESGRGGSATVVSSIDIPEEQLERLNEYYGFDKPLPLRYLRYLGNLVRLDLGESFRYTMPVEKLIASRFPVSIYFGVITALLTYSVCIPLGILKALKHKTTLDNVTSFVIFVGYAIPGYALGAVLLALFAVQRDWFPLSGFTSTEFASLSLGGKVKDLLLHTTLPLICYAVRLFAVMTILMKNSLMENMSADYVKAALARGLTWPRAVFIHALRNSLIPLATSFGNNISLILMGSLLIETVFNIPGIGLLFFESIQSRDYPVVMGFTVIAATLLLVGNLLSDLCVAAVDPRVRFGE
ncbi:MAG: ABC transporter permease [Candidatus Eiseniibacteriota bacterium]|jgi:microcin C transport system permease protein